MARPEKHTVDYFPFYVKDGKTLFILEGKYGCKGTGFFTNVLRFLCERPDHHCCIQDDCDRLFFFSRTRCDEESGMDMLNMMAQTGKIDKDLWVSYRVIVSQDHLDSIRDAYRNRINDIIDVHQIRVSYVRNQDSDVRNTPTTGISDVSNPQTKLNKTKLNKTYSVSFTSFWEIYPKKVGKEPAWKSWQRRNDIPDFSLLKTAIEKFKKTDRWVRGFIPDPATWINQGRWSDDPESMNGGDNGGRRPYEGKRTSFADARRTGNGAGGFGEREPILPRPYIPEPAPDVSAEEREKHLKWLREFTAG